MTQRPRIYLDHAATTPILPAAKAAMAEAMGRWANPSSPHAEGRAARAALEDARERVKRALGWTGELIFTSGATEAIEIALGHREQPVFYSVAEHQAVKRVLDPQHEVGLDERGFIDLSRWGAGTLLSGAGPAILAVQSASNETGVLQPLDEVAERVKGLPDVLLFSDCAQTAGKLPLPPADMIAVSAHKLGGPPGIGALLIRDLRMLSARTGQEKGYRPGTENLPAILGFAAALGEREQWMDRAGSLRDTLDKRIVARGGEIAEAATPRIPTIASYRMPGVGAAAQLIHFDLQGIAISAGSACSSGSVKPSQIFNELGWNPDEAAEFIRVSFGPQTTAQDIDVFAQAWDQLASRRRAA